MAKGKYPREVPEDVQQDACIYRKLTNNSLAEGYCLKESCGGVYEDRRIFITEGEFFMNMNMGAIYLIAIRNASILLRQSISQSLVIVMT